MTSFIVDVSHHDYDRGSLSWSSVRGAGIEAMIAKATEGDPSGYHFADPRFTAAVSAARAAGMPITGGYHCLSHGDAASAARQVDFFLQHLSSVGGYGKGWAMIDVEPFPELKSIGKSPKLSDVLEFQAAWHTKTSGWPLAVYLPKWYWQELGSPSLAGITGILVSSNYPISARQPFASLYAHDGGDKGTGWNSYGNKAPAVWQFASSDAVPGITGNCDCNAYKGTYAQFEALVMPKPRTTPPTPPPHPLWPGRILSNVTPMMHGADVLTWQRQMAKRGWTIGTDGFYGPQSESVCKSFQVEKKITKDRSGEVGPTTWNDAWTSPVT